MPGSATDALEHKRPCGAGRGVVACLRKVDDALPELWVAHHVRLEARRQRLGHRLERQRKHFEQPAAGRAGRAGE